MSRSHPSRRRPAGVLELLVVMVIIGLLAGYVAPRYFSQVGKVKVAQAQINAFEKALDTYRLDVGRYPTTEQGLLRAAAAPAERGEMATGPTCRRPCRSIPGQSLPVQVRPVATSEFDVWSFGKDGQPGTAENADITSW